jgi:hypothetical protein
MTTLPQKIQSEFDYFIAHQDELVSKYANKIIVLHDNSVAGVFDNQLDAFLFCESHFDPETYAIQKCIPGKRAYTIKISTPGMINA